MRIIFYPAVSPKPLWHQGWVLWKIVFQRTGRRERFQDVSSTLRLLCTFSSVHSVVSHSATLWIAAYQASLSIMNSWSLLKLICIQSVMPFNHLILCRPLSPLPLIFLSIRVFSNEFVLQIRWPKYWSFSFSISPSNEYSGLISFRMDWLDLLVVQETLKSSPTPHF